MGNQNEIWKDIDGYEGLYQISDKRRIKSLDYRRTGEERVLKPRKTKDGYLHVGLCKEGKIKFYLIHRLIAQTFLENPEGLPEINHKDEDKTNNCAENLEWCSHQYNNNYGTRIERISKSKSIPVMCVETNTIYLSTHDAQRKTGIDAANIGKCANHKKYYHTARRYHWEFCLGGE